MSGSDVVLSSSPSSGRTSSPVRRKGSVSTHDLSDLNRPRLSPTLSRTYDPNDPEARERQRTMDVDMAKAMQLSRARRDTINMSPTLDTGRSAEREREEGNFDNVFSSREEHELDIARGTVKSPDDIDDESILTKRPGSSIDFQSHLNQGQDPSLLVGIDQPQPQHDDPSTSNFGALPTYQPNPPNSYFDFAPMEEFAAAEKITLGISSSPTMKFSTPPRLTRPPTEAALPIPPHSLSEPVVPRDETGALATAESVTFTEGAGPSTSGSEANIPSPRPSARQRKLSQSNTPRQRKGIGGRLAKFEGQTGQPPASLSGKLSAVLGGLGGGSDNGSTHDGPPITTAHSLPTGLSGILNTGHDRPYRFSFYSNALSATIHARSLSELPAEGQTFQDLFAGINSNADKDFLEAQSPPNTTRHNGKSNTTSGYFPGATASNAKLTYRSPMTGGLDVSDSGGNTWWLDVTSPTDEEMKLLSKVFHIHPLTTEDIQMEETREKIELFKNYYLVCFRSFDQDPYSPTYLEPLNMYIIVFREGTLSFHFRPTPHPSNVRRRIKQLKDYISVTSDWISYALIDDITDAFGPLIQSIEYEVDSIDELVLILKDNLKESREQTDMLRRIGTCRKKVMGLLRLMGNKADVVKGLAKRCNENWQVAPTGDIGLYLSDIQDHLITMTQNLNHYEKILSRSHSNYLAQISIEMTDANNQINDVLSKLTALGTVLIPMNLVTGLWGMNVHVPGENAPEGDLTWFGCIIAGLALFAVIGGYTTYKLMRR
ncbi:manganese resistance protein mnr2 [Moniliophthora roreri MCA 2997]|uniref:Manganese resistance protein mnr2 n=1 Tax=Moniliophthora roreri (strain MCA 2997) TaxID=1381753 RepID=V2X2Z3_MONRO|nr:manganese resistance protein mnr2 [Moniliophthora roreri MCA 2997]